MKRLFFTSIVIFSTSINASELIYKNGFEANALVSGTVLGLTSSGLILTLQSNDLFENLSITSNGTVIFNLEIDIGEEWSVTISQFPDSPQQNCELENESGVMPFTGSNSLTVTCNQSAWNWDEMNWGEGGWN